MRTASAKRKRGGHNKREGVTRHPSGGINYAAERQKEAVKMCVTSARIRVHKVTAADAQSQEAGSVFGRLYLQGELGERAKKGEVGPAEEAYAAGIEFGKRRAAYLAAIVSPRATRSGSDIGYVHETVETNADDQTRVTAIDPDDYVEQCQRARARFADIRRVCLEADPFAVMALETIVAEDKLAESLVGALRIGCNAIARMMRNERRR